MAIGKPKNQDVPVTEQQNLATRGGGRSLERRPGIGRAGMTPFSFVRRMMEDMDRMFEGFGESPLEGWLPQVETLERDGNLIVRADLPGLDKKDIQVNLEDDAIVIAGERRSEQEDEREGYFHSERSYGSFQRRIPLPRGVEPSSCDATFENGVLEVKLKLPKRGGRNVEIKGTSGGATPTQNAPVSQANQPATRSSQNGPPTH